MRAFMCVHFFFFFLYVCVWRETKNTLAPIVWNLLPLKIRISSSLSSSKSQLKTHFFLMNVLSNLSRLAYCNVNCMLVERTKDI